MKRQWQIALLMLAVVFALSSSTAAVTAAPAAKPGEGWSSITVWAFIDNDGDGFITPGDNYLHEVDVRLTHKQAHQTFYGATDYGDVWWEPMVGGTFVTWLDAKDADIPAGYKLNSITCYSSGVQAKGKLCTTRIKKWEAQFKQVPGALMNVYYGFVPAQ